MVTAAGLADLLGLFLGDGAIGDGFFDGGVHLGAALGAIAEPVEPVDPCAK